MSLHTSRKIFIAVALGVLVTVQASTPVGASVSLKALKNDLLSASNAQPLGFPKVLEPARSSPKSGEKACPDGAAQVFSTDSGQMGLASEVLACTSTKAAEALLAQVWRTSSPVSVAPPRSLGSSAIERDIGRSTYAIYWRRGLVVELVALTTDLAAATSSTTSTTSVPTPLSSAQQTTLVDAAVQQNRRLH